MPLGHRHQGSAIDDGGDRNAALAHAVRQNRWQEAVFAPILRAGLTFAEGMLQLVPTARMAHIGLYREPETFAAIEYFFKAPLDLAERLIINRRARAGHRQHSRGGVDRAYGTK